MTTELQNEDNGMVFDSGETDQDTNQTLDSQTETGDVSESDLATDNSNADNENNNSDSNDNNSGNQQEPELTADEKAQKAINKQHFLRREAERKHEATLRRLEELEQKFNQGSNTSQAVQQVPDIPDSWDDNYEQKILDRDAIIAKNAEIRATEAVRQQNENLENERRQEQQRVQVERQSRTFSDNAKSLGIDQKSLDMAQETVVNYGLTDPDIATFLLEDKQGPAMVQFLAANPEKLDQLINSSQFSAGVILSEIKTLSTKSKPNVSRTPSPSTRVSGRGTQKGERGPKGATFE